ncbi:MAG TPA: tetratricopeptide repeat protein [Polyangiaceae bacterium]|nr:tetratricopeptide repeat protein [Polyangiaceae bacterium]
MQRMSPLGEHQPEANPYASPKEAQRIPYLPPFRKRVWRGFVRGLAHLERWLVRWFRSHEPRLRYAILPFLLLAAVLFMRHPSTNYIFDEQEALLANPYVNAIGGLKYLDAIHRDFWGLPPNGSIGSYRPLPNFLWRATWVVTTHPFFHHLYNIVIHALNAALLASFAYAATRRRLFGWLTGAIFLTAAVITEAVTGIVGIADVLGGLGAILGLCALRLPAWAMGPAVFASMLLGIFSKESALVCVPLLPLAALLLSPMFHPARPRRVARALIVFVAAAAAFVLYVELRKEWFQSPLPAALEEPLPADASNRQILYRELLIWFHQAPLPKDPLNNPLVEADFPHRVAGALRVFWRGFTQVLAPVTLSGDYSYPQEPIPERLFEWETVAGGLLSIVPLLAAIVLYLVVLVREHRDAKRVPFPMALVLQRPFHRKFLGAAAVFGAAGMSGLATEYFVLRDSPITTWPWSVALLIIGLGFLIEGWRGPAEPVTALGPWPWRYVAPLFIALGGVWMVVSYFPHSNIPVLLPTVRAERFWYYPVIGSSLVLAVVLSRATEALGKRMIWRLALAPLLVSGFLGFQAMQTYRHTMDFRDDLAFWGATKDAVPRSAKAHLNYSVMVGARGDLQTRLRESHIARKLAPDWAMAHIYTGDTLCRMHRAAEAWPYYKEGFHDDPNARSLIALALQCLYDEKQLLPHDKELRALSEEHGSSWLAYLAVDTLDNHEKHKGVDPEYRPRGYNQGPKEDEKEE